MAVLIALVAVVSMVGFGVFSEPEQHVPPSVVEEGQMHGALTCEENALVSDNSGMEINAPVESPVGTIDANSVFVIMPLSSEELSSIYKNILKPTCEAQGMVCHRADDYKSGKMIMREIWQGITRARIVLADITGYNPSVMYELGIAHALGKDTILIMQAVEPRSYIPFDLAHIRIIQYSDSAVGGKKLETDLATAIESTLAQEKVQSSQEFQNK